MIDTHVHHLDLRRFRYPWLHAPEFDALRRDYLPADYRADAGDLPIEGWVQLLEQFGPRRCMFGSNFPVERLAGDLGSLCELVVATLAELSDEERRQVLAGTARRFYRLGKL